MIFIHAMMWDESAFGWCMPCGCERSGGHPSIELALVCVHPDARNCSVLQRRTCFQRVLSRITTWASRAVCRTTASTTSNCLRVWWWGDPRRTHISPSGGAIAFPHRSSWLACPLLTRCIERRKNCQWADWVEEEKSVSCALVVTCPLCLQEALKVMEFTEEEIRDVFKLLSAVLQMGNIEFMTAGGAQITSKGGRRRNNVLI